MNIINIFLRMIKYYIPNPFNFYLNNIYNFLKKRNIKNDDEYILIVNKDCDFCKKSIKMCNDLGVNVSIIDMVNDKESNNAIEFRFPLWISVSNNKSTFGFKDFDKIVEELK